MSESGADVDPGAVVIQRARMLAQIGRENDALDLIEEALADYPEDESLQLTNAWLHVRLDHPATARSLLEAIVASQPLLPYPLYLLSVTEAALGHNAQSRKYADRALELDPEGTRYHLQVAIAATGGLTIEPADRALARARIASCLELSPDDANVLQTAAELELRMGDLSAAHRYVFAALAIEPEKPDLLFLRSIVVGATVESVNKGTPTLSSLSHQIGDMGDILVAAPSHAAAGRLLFGRVWSRIFRTAGMAFWPLLVVACGIGVGMGDGPTLPFLIIAAILGAAWPLFRLFMSSRVLRSAPRGYVRRQVLGGRGARWRIAGSAVAAAVALVGIVSLLVVRDPVAIRGLLVAIACAGVIGSVAEGAWFHRYVSSALGSGVLDSTPSGLSTAMRFRKALTQSLVFRVIMTFWVSLLALLVSVGTRPDAAPVLLVVMLAWTGAALFGLVWMRRVDSLLRDEAIEVPVTIRPPGTVSGAVLGLTALAVAAALLLAFVQVPWLPSELDSHDAYVPTVGGPTECTGRPATRLACIVEKNEELTTPNPFPTPIEIPDFDVPEIVVPTFDPDIEVGG